MAIDETTDEPSVDRLFDLSGKVAVVTGGTGYLGGAIGRGLAEAGARVVITSRDQGSADSAAARLPPVASGSHAGIRLDHMDEDSLEQGFEQAIGLTGQVDVLVNNGHQSLGEDWTTVTGEQFTRQLANATGYFLLARLLRDHIVARQATGSVIMIGSMYGSVGSYPDAYADICPASPVAYQALKAGVIQMTRHLAVYWANDKVRVNCLSPGPFPGPQAPAELVERLKQKSPMGRMGNPYELKGAAVFLASSASSYMTGQNLLIDGGWSAW